MEFKLLKVIFYKFFDINRYFSSFPNCFFSFMRWKPQCRYLLIGFLIYLTFLFSFIFNTLCCIGIFLYLLCTIVIFMCNVLRHYSFQLSICPILNKILIFIFIKFIVEYIQLIVLLFFPVCIS